MLHVTTTEDYRIIKKKYLMIGMLSDKGNVRKKNEDYIGFYNGGNFQAYIVADGMGGYNAGEIASCLAVKTIINYMKKSKSLDSIKSQIIEAIKLANEKIFKLSSENMRFKKWEQL